MEATPTDPAPFSGGSFFLCLFSLNDVATATIVTRKGNTVSPPLLPAASQNQRLAAQQGGSAERFSGCSRTGRSQGGGGTTGPSAPRGGGDGSAGIPDPCSDITGTPQEHWGQARGLNPVPQSRAGKPKKGLNPKNEPPKDLLFSSVLTSVPRSPALQAPCLL